MGKKTAKATGLTSLANHWWLTSRGQCARASCAAHCQVLHDCQRLMLLRMVGGPQQPRPGRTAALTSQSASKPGTVSQPGLAGAQWRLLDATSSVLQREHEASPSKMQVQIFFELWFANPKMQMPPPPTHAQPVSHSTRSLALPIGSHTAFSAFACLSSLPIFIKQRPRHHRTTAAGMT